MQAFDEVLKTRSWLTALQTRTEHIEITEDLRPGLIEQAKKDFETQWTRYLEAARRTLYGE